MSAEKSLPEMRTEATSLLTSGAEHLEDGNYTDAADDLGSASELFAKVIFFSCFAKFLQAVNFNSCSTGLSLLQLSFHI